MILLDISLKHLLKQSVSLSRGWSTMSSGTKTQAQQLEDFIQSKEDFRIVYSSSKHVLPSTSHLIVLDSSFNPPHKAHLALAESALATSQAKNPTVVMLLSVKNADKVKPVPAPFDQRLRMMELLVSSFRTSSKSEPPHIVLALTNHAKFIDKAAALKRLYSTIHRFTFVMGFDTLTRFLDPKYYPLTPQDNDPLNSMLKQFFGPCNADIHCVIRSSPQWGTPQQQRQYVNQLASHLNVPDISKVITLSNAIPASAPDQPATETHEGVAISSSAARKYIHSGDLARVREMLTQHVFDYINENKIYKDGEKE